MLPSGALSRPINSQFTHSSNRQPKGSAGQVDSPVLESVVRVFLPGNTPPKQAEKHLTAGFPSQGDGAQNLSGPVPSLGSSGPLSLVPRALMLLVIMNPGQVVWMKPRVVFVLGHLPWAWAHRGARAFTHRGGVGGSPMPRACCTGEISSEKCGACSS